MKTQRTQKLMAAALVSAITLAVTSLYPAPAMAQGSSQSPLVTQMYDGQWPAKEDYAKFKDQLLFQRAVDAYMLSLPAPNADIIYSMSYLDLKKTGPLVVNAPPKVIGMFTDFFQRTLTDVGWSG